MKDVKVVKTALSRPNIKLEVKMRPPAMGEDSYDAVIEPYILELRRKGRQFPKTIVYCKLKWCGHAHELCYRPKHESLKEDNEDDTCEQYVAQFHAPCTEQMKLHALTNFRDEDGTLRLLFATEAYSMGTDVPDIRRIIHCGVPKSLEIYLQEVGRAGRDGNSAEATLYYNNTDISSNVPGLKPIMKVFCQTDTCRWKFLCEHFKCDFDLSELAHDCCDNCESKCACDDCQLQQVFAESMEETAELSQTTEPQVIQTVQALLVNYFDAENRSTGIPQAPLYNGLTDTLASLIAKDYPSFDSVSVLKDRYASLQSHYVENILKIINTVQASIL